MGEGAEEKRARWVSWEGSEAISEARRPRESLPTPGHRRPPPSRRRRPPDPSLPALFHLILSPFTPARPIASRTSWPLLRSPALPVFVSASVVVSPPSLVPSVPAAWDASAYCRHSRARSYPPVTARLTPSVSLAGCISASCCLSGRRQQKRIRAITNH